MREKLISLVYGIYNLFARRLAKTAELPPGAYDAINAYFDAIWVITIPRNATRQEQIKAELNGINFEFFNGVEGKNLVESDPRIDLVRAAEINRRTVRINELACTMSHLAVFEEILRRNLKRVLVFEDDAVFVRKRAKWVSYCLSRLPESWELFYLGYRDGELRGFLDAAKHFHRKGNRKDTVITKSVGSGIRTAAGHDFTHAYAVTNEGAKRLLEGAYPVSHTADGWLEHQVLNRKVSAYISVPKLFIQQEDLKSSIHS